MPYQTQHRGFEARAPYNAVEPVKEEEELIGSKFLDTAGQKIQETIASATADQEGIGDDLGRLVLGGLKNIGHVANLPGIKQGLQIAGAPAWAIGQTLGAGLEHGLGIDPRYGHIVGEVGEMFLPGYGAAKLGKWGLRAGARKLSKEARKVGEGWQLLTGGIGTGSGYATAGKAGKAIRTVDFQKVPSSRRRDEIGKYFNNIYTEGMSDAEKYTFLEKASFGGQAEKQGQKFIKSVAGTHRNLFGGSAHHFGIDLGLAGDTLNRSDAKEIVKYLNEVDIYPGNHPNNYIMAYHDYSQQISNAQKAALMDKGMPLQEADKFLKKTPQTKDLGIKELGNLNKYQVMDKLEDLTKVKRRDWRSKGVEPKELDLPPAFIGTDHQQFIHGIGDKLPKRQELIKLAKTDAWLELSPREAAKQIAEVVREQQNVALNVNKLRLQKVMKAMEFDPAKHDWIDIQAWMIQNPRHAAHLDWYKTAKKGIGKSIEELTADVPYNEAEFIAKIFNLEKVPQTGKKIRKFEYGFPNEIDSVRQEMRINQAIPRTPYDAASF